MTNLYFKTENEFSRILEREFSGNESLFITGGDGTYLRALRDQPLGKVPPVYAFNTGTVGILLPLSPKNIESLISKIRDGSLNWITRQRLYISSHSLPIVNELMILSKTCKLNYFEIYINDEMFKISGDSLIISTKDGSSGHNFSAGGPIAMADTVIINCIAANRCCFRPIVLPMECHLKIKAEGCFGVADGQEIQGEIFEIEKGDCYRVYVDEDYSSIRTIERQFFLL